MTTRNFDTIASAIADSKRCIKKAGDWLTKSHDGALFALDHCIEAQEFDALNQLRAVVVEEQPRLKGAFDAWVLAMLDNVKLVGTVYDDGGETFGLSDSAMREIPWHKVLTVREPSKKAIDPRASLKQLANKLHERGCKADYAKHITRKKANAQAIEILARALADLEAVHAGTYGATAQEVDQPENVVAIKATKAA